MRTTRRDRGARPAPDLVERDFTAEGPARLSVADITFIPTRAGLPYLAEVPDVFSRGVVGWATATHLRTELVLAALDMPVERRHPRGVIHHPGQGCRYTSLAFGQRCGVPGIRLSVGSIGDCQDNAPCDSVFATPECDLPARQGNMGPGDSRIQNMTIFLPFPKDR